MWQGEIARHHKKPFVGTASWLVQKKISSSLILDYRITGIIIVIVTKAIIRTDDG
jgi:hypothetical protein